MSKDLNEEEVFRLLFHEEASLLECYVGLLHWAAQAPRLQNFLSVAKNTSKRLTWADKRWAASLEFPSPSSLATLKQHLIEEATTTTGRLTVAVGAALKTLDRALEAVRDHLAIVKLPEEQPFANATYQLLRPAEHPIKNWIEEAGLPEIPRKAGDSRADLAAALSLHWRAFPLSPNPFQVLVAFEDLPSDLAFSLRCRIEAKQLTVGVVAPLKGLSYDLKGYPDDRHAEDGVPYRFKGLQGDGAEAKSDIAAVICRCRALQVDVLMYPELTLDPDLLLCLRRQLEWSESGDFPKMVIAGSFHESGQEAGCYVNRARVFDSLGREILQHDKLTRFRLTPHDLSKMEEEGRRELCLSLGIEAECGGFERIEQGQHLRIVDGPLGRMITSICLDYCGGSLEEIARRSLCNLFWVPTMSPSLGEFHKQAHTLGRECRATTVVANSEWLLDLAGVKKESREDLRSLCYLPFNNREPIKPEVDDDVESLRLFRIGEIIGGP